ncbi:hypothetical protein MYX75_02730 [Acidobacteria bacterium AH-259-A15]|nr:hypothetical protein [Acidobacteria bacterium AH-259-A15]
MSTKLGFTFNVFSFRGDGIDRSGTASGLWILRFWHRGETGLDVNLMITAASTDESIKQDMTNGLEQEVRRIGLGDRLTEQG